MRLITYEPASYAEKLNARIAKTPPSEEEVLFLTSKDGLRVLLGGMRESQEFFAGDSWGHERVLGQNVIAWEEFMDDLYQAVDVSRAESPFLPSQGVTFFTPVTRPENMSDLLRGSSSDPVPEDVQLVLAAHPDEIKAHIEMCEVTLKVLDEWEYELRMGFSTQQIRSAVKDLRQLLAAA